MSPSTGTTITDNNFDETENSNYSGNGSLICNFANQGEGTFSIEFTSAGTFVVSVQFVSSDSNTTVSDPLTVVVS